MQSVTHSQKSWICWKKKREMEKKKKVMFFLKVFSQRTSEVLSMTMWKSTISASQTVKNDLESVHDDIKRWTLFWIIIPTFSHQFHKVTWHFVSILDCWTHPFNHFHCQKKRRSKLNTIVWLCAINCACNSDPKTENLNFVGVFWFSMKHLRCHETRGANTFCHGKSCLGHCFNLPF